jgi:hypothetical protein
VLENNGKGKGKANRNCKFRSKKITGTASWRRGSIRQNNGIEKRQAPRLASLGISSIYIMWIELKASKSHT